MAEAEPTLSQVMWRLDAVSERLAELTTQLADDRRTAEARFVPREVYEARHATIRRDIDAVKADVEEKERSDAGFRRQILVMVFSSIFGAILALIITVLGSGGVPT